MANAQDVTNSPRARMAESTVVEIQVIEDFPVRTAQS